MKGAPSVLWTCDRCGVTDTAEPHGSPAQWWVWEFRAVAETEAQQTYEMCDRCDSAIRAFVDTAPREDI